MGRDAYPDYYRIELDGPWRLNLEFEHAVGDLDVEVWDVAGQQPERDLAEQIVGSYSQTDNESFEYEGGDDSSPRSLCARPTG